MNAIGEAVWMAVWMGLVLLAGFFAVAVIRIPFEVIKLNRTGAAILKALERIEKMAVVEPPDAGCEGNKE